MYLSIMLEGQNGVNWHNWKTWVETVEDLGFYGLYRSDHFTNANPPNKDSLELWASLVYLASHTKKIKFGPLVTPVSFRHPVFTARIAAAVDELSEGRLHLGIGAGWQEREHDMFGFDLLDIDPRFERFEEGILVIKKLLHSDSPVDFSGRYYQLREAELLPRPAGIRRIPITIGGNGRKKTLPLVAKYADEWNALMIPPKKLNTLRGQLYQLMEKENRPISEIRLSLMASLKYGESKTGLQESIKGKNIQEMKDKGVFVGVAEEIIIQLKEFEKLGVDEIMLQWLDLEDIDGLEHFARHVLPAFQ